MKRLWVAGMAFLLYAQTETAAAPVPPIIQFQGRLTDANGLNRHGAYNLKTRLFNAPAGGSLLWEKTFSSVTVTNGLFRLELENDDSSVNIQNAITSDQAYLELQVLAGPGIPSSESPLAPRQRLLSIAYSFTSEKTSQLLPGATAQGDLTLTNGGKLFFSGGGTPTLGDGCGATVGTIIAGHDSMGTLTFPDLGGILGPLPCTINFSSPWPAKPICFESSSNCSPINIEAISPTAFQLNGLTSLGIVTFDSCYFSYLCIGTK